MNILLIKILLLMTIVYVCSFFVGNVICSRIKGSMSICKSVIYGFTLLMTLFEILSIPAIVVKVKFSSLVNIYLFFAMIVLVYAVYVFVKENDYKKYIIKNVKFNVITFIGVIGAIIFIVIQVWASIYLQHSDADDGYYVTVSNIALEQDEICLEGNKVYHGMVSEEEAFRPEIAAWELFVAFLCKVVNVHPAIMCHTMLPAMLIILCYMVVYELAKKLFGDKNSIIMFIMFFAVLNIFSGYSIYSSGCFLLFRLWQGKAMLVNFAFPLLILNCIDIYREKDNNYTWAMNFAIICLGTMFTVVGIYLMPVFYFVVGAPFIFKNIWTKQMKKVIQLIVKAIISILPIIVLLLFMFYRVVSAESGKAYLDKQAPKWISVFNMIFSNKLILILFIIALIIIAIKGAEDDKYIFIGTPIVLMLTFLNPFLCEKVAKYITGVDVYWRLYWMLPLYITICYGFVLLCNEASAKGKLLVFVTLIVVLGYSGELIYTDKYFGKMTNEYKLPNQIICIADNLPSNSNCLLPENLSFYLRQYTSDIKVPKARNMMSTLDCIGDTHYTYSWLYHQIYTFGYVNEPSIVSLLNILEVDYIYYPNVENIKSVNVDIYMLDENSALIKVKK